jgi:S1-C subfamily serine protease
MEPTIARLQQDGFPVQKVDVDRNQRLADQFNVTSVPCFVLVSGGREINRVLGTASYEQLARMFDTVGPKQSTPQRAQVRAQTPDSPDRFSMLNGLVGGQHQSGANTSELTRSPVANANSPAAQQTALRATVKLKVTDPQGSSYGTGTIIDVHGEEALVVTCGHIFRDSGGRGEILVDLFTSGAPRSVAGTLITWDADRRDIALVSIRPGVAVTPALVASRSCRPARGDRVFSIGCDEGRPPTVRTSQITAIDKYVGPPNIEVAGQPIDGRSGGGLFTADGKLIGICNAADPSDDEGIYAALKTIHWQLDQIGQSRIYERNENQLASDRPANAPARFEQVTVAPPTSAADNPRFASAANQAAEFQADEVICIIRSPNHPSGTRMIVLNEPSTELLSRIRAESQNGRSSRKTELTQSRQPLVPVPQHDPFPLHSRRDTQVIRGQTSER